MRWLERTRNDEYFFLWKVFVIFLIFFLFLSCFCLFQKFWRKISNPNVSFRWHFDTESLQELLFINFLLVCACTAWRGVLFIYYDFFGIFFLQGKGNFFWLTIFLNKINEFDDMRCDNCQGKLLFGVPVLNARCKQKFHSIPARPLTSSASSFNQPQLAQQHY